MPMVYLYGICKKSQNIKKNFPWAEMGKLNKFGYKRRQLLQDLKGSLVLPLQLVYAETITA